MGHLDTTYINTLLNAIYYKPITDYLTRLEFTYDNRSKIRIVISIIITAQLHILQFIKFRCLFMRTSIVS